MNPKGNTSSFLDQIHVSLLFPHHPHMKIPHVFGLETFGPAAASSPRALRSPLELEDVSVLIESSLPDDPASPWAGAMDQLAASAMPPNTYQIGINHALCSDHNLSL